jgi:hypothetical protein
MTKEELINDDHDGLNIPETINEQWFLDMLNESELAPEEYYERSAVPEYIIASTSYDADETYVFEANADGSILSFDEYGGLAERWGDHKWYDAEAAVKSCMPHTYHLISVKGNHALFKLVEPDEYTHFDGDESDRISY